MFLIFFFVRRRPAAFLSPVQIGTEIGGVFLRPFELAGFEAALPGGKIGVTLEGVNPRTTITCQTRLV